MKYQYRLEYATESGKASLDELLADGWEPVPHTVPVVRDIRTGQQVFVWIRKAIA